MVKVRAAQLLIVSRRDRGHPTGAVIRQEVRMDMKPRVRIIYAYDMRGRIATVGTSSRPRRHGAYRYNPDGSVAQERLHARRCQRRFLDSTICSMITLAKFRYKYST